MNLEGKYYRTCSCNQSYTTKERIVLHYLKTKNAPPQKDAPTQKNRWILNSPSQKERMDSEHVIHPGLDCNIISRPETLLPKRAPSWLGLHYFKTKNAPTQKNGIRWILNALSPAQKNITEDQERSISRSSTDFL